MLDNYDQIPDPEDDCIPEQELLDAQDWAVETTWAGVDEAMSEGDLAMAAAEFDVVNKAGPGARFRLLQLVRSRWRLGPTEGSHPAFRAVDEYD